jgi:hypothetical protein
VLDEPQNEGKIDELVLAYVKPAMLVSSSQDSSN